MSEGLDDCTHYEGKDGYAIVDGATYEATRKENERLRAEVEHMEVRLLHLMESVRRKGLHDKIFTRDLTEWLDDYWQRMPAELREECEYHRKIDEVLRRSREIDPGFEPNQH